MDEKKKDGSGLWILVAVASYISELLMCIFLYLDTCTNIRLYKPDK